MKFSSASIKIYFGLIFLLAFLSALSVLFPYDSTISSQDLPASIPVLALANAGIAIIFYGGLGYVGLILSKKLGFPEIWDKKISNKQRFLIPAFIGLSIGLFFIFSDLILSQFNPFGPFVHPPFPLSIIASAIAGIGEEIIFRLFFITFWVWIISHIIFKKRWQNIIFWIVSILSAIAFAIAHFPSVMIIYGIDTFYEIPVALITEIILLNGVLSLFAAYYFRKFGFLAAVSIHFWVDIIWHVIYGLTLS